MWVGNVPADASQEELFRFFNQPHPPPDDDGNPSLPAPSRGPVSGGVTSVFLISHSNCAFVNFESQAQLDAATTTFNGCKLRGEHARGSRLVCRAYRPEDEGDGHPGVNRQRRSGVHVKWVRDRQLQKRASERPRAPSTVGGSGSSEQVRSTSRPVTVEDITSQFRFLSRVADVPASPPEKDEAPSNPGSPASTTSSLLATHFPQRYFILKSLSQVRSGICGDFTCMLTPSLAPRAILIRACARAGGLLSRITRIS